MIGQRLYRARKAAGLSLRDLGDKIGLTHSAIKKYEDGQTIPPSITLIKLAKILNVRIEYFFRTESLALDHIEYRKKSTLSKKRLQAIEHEIIDQIERRIELENLYPTPPVKQFTPIEDLPKLLTDFDQIEDIAEIVRKKWNLGYDPIPDLIDVLETHGIRVFTIDAHADNKFDGLAASVNEMPIVVVGSNWPGDRQRFTLAHELGHQILANRLAKNLDEETACNRFAGAFLIPRQSVIEELGAYRNNIELRELALLKEEFGLSMASILFRVQDLNIVTSAWRKEKTILFRINKWHRKEPGQPYPAEKAHLFEQLVFHALAEEYIGESKAAELMKMSLTNFRARRALECIDVTHQ